jgi:YVTN family beta-propeller protein
MIGQRPRLSRKVSAAGVIVWLAAILLATAAGAPYRAYADGGAPNLAYVAGGGAGGNDLTVIDIAQRKVTGHVTLGGAPAAVALSVDARFAYVSQSASNTVAVVDTRTQQVVARVQVGPGPRALAFGYSINAVVLFVTVSGGNAVAVVDPDARKVLATIPVGSHPTGVAVATFGTGIVAANPNESEVYVANTGSDTVSVISALQRKVIATIPTPGGPVGVVIPSSGGVAYVSTSDGAVLAVGLASHTVLGTLYRLPGGAAAGQMDYDAVTGEIYVPDAASGIVAVLAPANSGGRLPVEPDRTLAIPGGPAAVAITFDGAYGFVAERNAGRMAMLDPARHKVLATIAVGGTPQGIVTGAYPPLLDRQTANITGYIIIALLGACLIYGIVVVTRDARKGGPLLRKARRSITRNAKAREQQHG